MDGKHQLRLLPVLNNLGIVLSLFFLIGCAPTAAELPGKYEAKFDFGKMELLLKPDGTYEQEFLFNNKKRLTNQGRWAFPNRGVFAERLVLYDALQIYDGSGSAPQNPKKVAWIMEPQKFLGGVNLKFSSELNVKFVKLEP